MKIPARVTFDPMGEAEPSEAKDTRPEKEMGRRMKITSELLQRYCYSEECEGCRRKRAGIEPRPHMDKCRARIWEEMRH